MEACVTPASSPHQGVPVSEFSDSGLAGFALPGRVFQVEAIRQIPIMDHLRNPHYLQKRPVTLLPPLVAADVEFDVSEKFPEFLAQAVRIPASQTISHLQAHEPDGVRLQN